MLLEEKNENKLGNTMSGNYWLLKSEPESFSIQDLANAPQQTTCWDGVRNYQARNMLRDLIQPGDLAFFYHSNAKPPGIVGIAKVVKKGYPDPSQFDKKSKYFDASATREKPRWYSVDIQLDRVFNDLIALDTLKNIRSLSKMILLNRSRLSVQPVSKEEWTVITKLVH